MFHRPTSHGSITTLQRAVTPDSAQARTCPNITPLLSHMTLYIHVYIQWSVTLSSHGTLVVRSRGVTVIWVVCSAKRNYHIYIYVSCQRSLGILPTNAVVYSKNVTVLSVTPNFTWNNHDDDLARAQSVQLQVVAAAASSEHHVSLYTYTVTSN